MGELIFYHGVRGKKHCIKKVEGLEHHVSNFTTSGAEFLGTCEMQALTQDWDLGICISYQLPGALDAVTLTRKFREFS